MRKGSDNRRYMPEEKADTEECELGNVLGRKQRDKE